MDWIPMTQPPIERGRYLAYHYYLDMVVAIYWDGKKWDGQFDITHWMPLPKSPKDYVAVLEGMNKTIAVYA